MDGAETIEPHNLAWHITGLTDWRHLLTQQALRNRRKKRRRQDHGYLRLQGGGNFRAALSLLLF